MSRVADVLAELNLLGAMGNELPAEPKPVPVVKKAPVSEAKIEEDAPEGEDYDPVALLTEGFRDSLPSEDATDADEESAEDGDDVAVEDDEDTEDSAEDEDAEEVVDLAPVVSKLLKEVEAMSEQMQSLLWSVRELDALLK